MATTEHVDAAHSTKGNGKFVFGIVGVLAVGILAGFGSTLLAGSSAGAYQTDAINTGDTAWVLASSALVMIMTPAVGFFYGGMVRSKNVVSVIKQSLVILALVSVQWVLFGYSLAFGVSQRGFIGWSGEFLGLKGVMSNEIYYGTHVPIYVHCMYQGMFAIITPALISVHDFPSDVCDYYPSTHYRSIR